MTPIPAGWKLVPIEPTDAMLDAGCGKHVCTQGDPWYSSPDLSEGDCKAIYAAMLDSAPSPASVAPGDAQDGLAEAQRLAQALFQRHFALDDDYASGRVKWEVLGDLPGVLSQIDNMVSGLVRPATPAAGDALDARRYRLAVADCILVLRGDAALGRAEWDSKLDKLAKTKGDQ